MRDGLRSGDIFVPGSRRYADPGSFLLTPGAWAPGRLEFCHLVGKPAAAAGALALAGHELHTALANLESQLAKGNPGEVRLTGDGELIIPLLTAEDVPAEAEALRGELAGMLPRLPLASVLVEIDARTGFTNHLVHVSAPIGAPVVKRAGATAGQRSPAEATTQPAAGQAVAAEPSVTIHSQHPVIQRTPHGGRQPRHSQDRSRVCARSSAHAWLRDTLRGGYLKTYQEQDGSQWMRADRGRDRDHF